MKPHDARMRLLLVNANTDRDMTDRLVAQARALLPPGADVIGVSARFGSRYIATRAGYAVAGYAVLDAYAEAGERADAIVLACFGDPGLAALRELACVPVIGMAEAACRSAAKRFARFSIVTGGAGWPAMLDEYVTTLGLRDRVASIRAVQANGAQIATNPAENVAALARECRRAADDDGAQAVILGGAGLVGIAPAIVADVPVPVLDSFAEAVSAASERASTPAGPAGGGATEPVETVGLGARLTALMTERRLR